MKKKRGSILIYVMAIFAVLMIMGVTLTTLSLQSMKNRKYYSNNRVNLYYSESGIDEAYGIATEYVKDASNYALNETNTEIEQIIEKDKEILEKIFLLNQKLNNEQLDEADKAQIRNQINSLIPNLNFYNKEGELDKELDEGAKKTKLESKQDELFKKNYINFFNLKDKNDNTNIMQLLSSMEKKEDFDGRKKVIEVMNPDVMPGETFTINIKSTFKKDNIEKIISADFKFTTPNYGSKISFPTKYVVFPESPVWNKGIVVNKTLSIGETTLNVNGDIYVKGVEKDTKMNIAGEKAIILNSKMSGLTVKNGNVIACEGVKFNYASKVDKSAGAKVNIEKSIYTKGILFNKEIDQDAGAQGATLNVTDSVYVHDDCEINAKNSTFNVGYLGDINTERSYYGVSNGDNAKENKVDNSSSIIINSGDLGKTGSTVNIAGKVYLAGTSYIWGLNNPAYNDDYNYAYQTGESISIKENYKAYSENLKDSFVINDIDLKYELVKSMLDPLVLATHYNKYSKWFTTYGEEKKIYFGMSNQLKEKYEQMGWIYPYKINVEGLEDKEFQIGMNESTEINVLENLIKNNKLNIKLVDADGKLIEEMKVPKLEDNIKAFLVEDNKVFVTITPKGEMDDSLKDASYIRVNGKKGEFNKFIEIPKTTEGNIVSVSIYNSSDSIPFINKPIKLLSYSDYFQSFNVTDKSMYFAEFYKDYKGEGISIGDVDNSIYTGALVSENGVKSTNYRDKHIENDDKVKEKKAELKKKIFYMDIFEKKKTKTPPENETKYQVKPEDLLNINSNDKDSLETKGLYISADDTTEFTSKELNNKFGIIICAGDVYLEGPFTFTGTIITRGNLYVKDGKNVNINYDDALVKRVIAKNYDMLKNVFVNLPGYELDKVKVEIYDKQAKNKTAPSVPLTIEKWAVIK